MKLELEPQEVQTIMDALQELPWRRVANLIPKVLKQVNGPPQPETLDDAEAED